MKIARDDGDVRAADDVSLLAQQFFTFFCSVMSTPIPQMKISGGHICSGPWRKSRRSPLEHPGSAASVGSFSEAGRGEH
jgi:hypothetical protein